MSALAVRLLVAAKAIRRDEYAGTATTLSIRDRETGSIMQAAQLGSADPLAAGNKSDEWECRK